MKKNRKTKTSSFPRSSVGTHTSTPQRRIIITLAVLAAVAILTCTAHAAQRPNILFIAIDDMNDWTGFAGGHPQAKTPNMDRLADKGVNFRNAHCPGPGCSPSRNALLFGIEPFNSGLYPFYKTDEIDPAILAKFTTLPQLFKESGYNTYASGKIHHGTAWTYQLNDGKREWTEHNHDTIKSLPKLVYDTDAGYVAGSPGKQSRKMAFCPTTSPLDHHPDYNTAMYGIDVLNRQHDKPFFLALGFVKPHLPFVAPKEFFDMYPDPIKPPKIKADDLADISWAGRGNARLNDDLRFRSDKAWEKVRRAYLACISWTDANVGRVLDALEKSPWRDNTIVILWSDHGYHLGEKRSFRKFSLWEEATNVPFIIWDTRGTTNGVTDEPFSLIDIYPTLTEMAGLKKPDYVDGVSLTPWLKNPNKKRNQPAITTWGRGNYSIRTKDWRYTRYFDGTEELYNHKNDQQEWTNLANSPECQKKKEELKKYLPKNEAPLIKTGISLHSVADADKPDLQPAKNLWKKVNATINPPLD